MSDKLAKYKLSMAQLKMGELVATRDVHNMTIQEMCDEVGISDRTYYRWRKDPAFKKYLDEISQQIMDSFLADTYARLRNIVSNGKDRDALKGIEMVLKTRGLLKDNEGTTVNVNTTLSQEALEREVIEMEQELLDVDLDDE